MTIKSLAFLGNFLRSLIWLPLLSILITNNQPANRALPMRITQSQTADTQPQLLMPTGVQSTAFYVSHPDRTHHKNKIYH